ncbi:L-seryl-tRNA(Sec) selenium transferase [Bacillus sp. FJAT-44742]|uniref:L-seryl-tRNA(Sec) selenium transferase n=1 Tax=Bacillus sp. FJAT-44742 TaxID=2014005 RepID=UPI000C24F035|nr:L-seryl-tRNA(Sec) selenium transferase [Bacillus sp. FJAT-44742]
MEKLFRGLPAVHKLKSDKRFLTLANEKEIPYTKLTEWIQEEIEVIRDGIRNNEYDYEENPRFVDEIFLKVERKAVDFHCYRLKRVINATGTILHTNLGRAKLSEEAIEQVIQTATNYSNLEYNIEEGKRGSRHDIIESILKEITGAEGAMVVNNNAAAVYLILRALAKGKEVIVSRGELVEIGGSFRVSSIMEESEAKLKEVGTTNKTHLSDYECAINEDTSLLMKVHTSNFKTIGFTKSVKATELTDLASQYKNVMVYEDLGSGALHDFRNYGIGDEPTVDEVVKSGVDIVSFSGDKLLGGPQAGIIVGKKELINKLKKHQLARVLRVDKMTLAALEATIKAYLKGNASQIPAIGDILTPLTNVKDKAEIFMTHINTMESKRWQGEVREETAQIGGGTMPGVEIPTCVVTLTHSRFSSQQIFDLLREGEPTIIARLKNEKVLIDFRTVAMEEIPLILNKIKKVKEG